jgi:folate-binding protein YgfZ
MIGRTDQVNRMSAYIPLKHRALIAISGEDRRTFLQGLVSADVEQASAVRALYGAYLTPQGKFLYDFFLAEQDDALLLEVEQAGRDDLIKRLSRFRLRSKVSLAPKDDWRVYAIIGAPEREAGSVEAWQGGLSVMDPRLAAAGQRVWLPAPPDLPEGAFEDWDCLRIRLGLADGSRDMVPEKTILLEAGFDELHGVDWAKGCFMGQEVTARSKYRGQIKKRLLPVEIDGPAPQTGTILTIGGQEVGEMRSHQGSIGLAVIRLDSLDRGPLSAGDTRLTPKIPAWVRL